MSACIYSARPAGGQNMAFRIFLVWWLSSGVLTLVINDTCPLRLNLLSIIVSRYGLTSPTSCLVNSYHAGFHYLKHCQNLRSKRNFDFLFLT